MGKLKKGSKVDIKNQNFEKIWILSAESDKASHITPSLPKKQSKSDKK